MTKIRAGTTPPSLPLSTRVGLDVRIFNWNNAIPVRINRFVKNVILFNTPMYAKVVDNNVLRYV